MNFESDIDIIVYREIKSRKTPGKIRDFIYFNTAP